MPVANKGSGDGLTSSDINDLNTNHGFIQEGVVVRAQGTPDFTVQTSAGVLYYNEARVTVAADSSITVTAADGTNDRIDIIHVPQNGTVAYTAGTAAASPVEPDVPVNNIIVARIRVATGVGTITNDDISNASPILGHPIIIKDSDAGSTGGTSRGTLVIPADKYTEWAQVSVSGDISRGAADSAGVDLTGQKSGETETAVRTVDIIWDSAGGGKTPFFLMYHIDPFSDTAIFDSTLSTTIRLRSNSGGAEAVANLKFSHIGR